MLIQQTAVVHLGQADVQPRARVEEAADLMALRLGSDEVVRRAAADVLLDAVERLLRDGAAVRDREPENLEPQRTVSSPPLSASRNRMPSRAISN